jgi:hypothetical protein
MNSLLQKRVRSTTTKTDWFLMIIFLLLNGSGSVGVFEYRFIFFSLLLLGFMIFTKKENLIRKVVPFFICYLFVFIMQSFTLKYISWPGVANNLCRYLSGGLVIVYLGERFRNMYFNAMFWFSFFGLFFWSIYVSTGFSIDLFPSVYQDEIVIWSVRPGEIRNSGPFWEPGAYAGYLLIIPLLYLNNIKTFFFQNKSKIIILTIALISTMSTTGYLGFALILVYVFGLKDKIRFSSIFLSSIVVIGIWFAASELDFLGDKVENQYNNALLQDGEFSNTRFGALVFDMYYIEKRPIFGNGFHESTRFEDHPALIELAENNEMGHGNGFSNMLASVGFFFFVMYIYFIKKKLRVSFRLKDAWFFVIMIIILLQGEQFLLFPLFLGLPAIILPEKKKLKIQ